MNRTPDRTMAMGARSIRNSEWTIPINENINENDILSCWIDSSLDDPDVSCVEDEVVLNVWDGEHLDSESSRNWKPVYWTQLTLSRDEACGLAEHLLVKARVCGDELTALEQRVVAAIAEKVEEKFAEARREAREEVADDISGFLGDFDDADPEYADIIAAISRLADRRLGITEQAAINPAKPVQVQVPEQPKPVPRAL